jgi:tRNA(Ile)-lysidine synthase
LEESFPEMGNKKLLLAISGGIDSMVLLDLLSKTDLELYLAHCNFKLRGEDADADEAFVRSEAEKYHKMLHVAQFDTKAYASIHKCSIQMAARELRYSWFKDLLNEKEYDYLLTAHHADDNLETFFINLSRGTGIDGLCGIPEKSNYILRPLLPFSKEDIQTYATEQKLRWREDHSNEDSKYLRNKIRKELTPLLKEINPSFLESFSSTLNHLKETNEIVGDAMQIVRDKVIEKQGVTDPSVIHFKVKDLLEFSNNTAYLYQLFYPFGFHQWGDIKSLLVSQSGKQIFSKTHRLLKHREYLLLSEITENHSDTATREIQDADTLIDLDASSLEMETIKTSGSEFNKKLGNGPNYAHFDKDLLTYPLSVRKWEKGDYFYPIGMTGKKKLSKFFKDEKYSLLDKENIWLLCSGADIIWIIGKRMDNRFKISDKTKTILKVTLQT